MRTGARAVAGVLPPPPGAIATWTYMYVRTDLGFRPHCGPCSGVCLTAILVKRIGTRAIIDTVALSRCVCIGVTSWTQNKIHSLVYGGR